MNPLFKFAQNFLRLTGTLLLRRSHILSYKNTKGVEAIQDKLDIFLSEEKHLEKALITIKKNQASEPGSGWEKGDPPG